MYSGVTENPALHCFGSNAICFQPPIHPVGSKHARTAFFNNTLAEGDGCGLIMDPTIYVHILENDKHLFRCE